MKNGTTAADRDNIPTLENRAIDEKGGRRSSDLVMDLVTERPSVQGKIGISERGHGHTAIAQLGKSFFERVLQPVVTSRFGGDPTLNTHQTLTERGGDCTRNNGGVAIGIIGNRCDRAKPLPIPQRREASHCELDFLLHADGPVRSFRRIGAHGCQSQEYDNISVENMGGPPKT